MREPRDPLLKVVTIFNRGGPESHSNRRQSCLKRERGHYNRPPKGSQVCGVWKGGAGTRPQHGVATGAGRSPLPREVSIMILPQVHLRKPCYDFYFL